MCVITSYSIHYTKLYDLQREGVAAVRAHEGALLARLIAGLREIPEVELYGPLDSRFHGGALSFNLVERDPAEVGFLLERDHGIRNNFV